jgi:hypothetical protein
MARPGWPDPGAYHTQSLALYVDGKQATHYEDNMDTSLPRGKINWQNSLLINAMKDDNSHSSCMTKTRLFLSLGANWSGDMMI